MFRVSAVALAVLAALALPSVAAAGEELSTGDRLDERRFVVTGPRAYEVATEAGRYPAMGFHTRGEMGGSGRRRSSSSTASGSGSTASGSAAPSGSRAAGATPAWRSAAAPA
jgi:hypothetical protein